jgi:hypothetical protein
MHQQKNRSFSCSLGIYVHEKMAKNAFETFQQHNKDGNTRQKPNILGLNIGAQNPIRRATTIIGRQKPINKSIIH